MPDAFEIALTEKITRMCVAKEGATTYYVDGATGNDGANGLTWESAKKTVQAAIDIADSWADIYIKAGTYTERAVLAASTKFLHLIGVDRDAVILKEPATGIGSPLEMHGTKSITENMTVESVVHPNAITLLAYNSIVRNCLIKPCATGIAVGGAYNVIDNVRQVGYSGNAIIVDSNYHDVRNCYLKDITSIYGAIYVDASYVKVHDNDIMSCSKGTRVDGGETTIYHNNFVSCTDPGVNNGPSGLHRNAWFENYYDGHTNVDNGSGIATDSFTIVGATGGTDPRPVIELNGWLAHALSGVSGNAVADLTGRTISGDTGLIAHGTETVCSAVIGQSGKRAILQGGVVRGIQDGLAAGKKLTLRVYKYNGTGWDKVDDYDVTKDSGLEANIGHAAHDDYMKIAVLHDDATGTKTFYYKFIIQDMEE